jgi:DAACS family dicarboxylate/amino acid:cation (Na+ or H+) symporter
MSITTEEKPEGLTVPHDPAAPDPIDETANGEKKKKLTISLALQILLALLAGIAAGKLFGGKTEVLKPLGDTIIQLLRLLATPLIFLAVVTGLSKAKVEAKSAKRLVYFLLTNTLAAILFALLIANIFTPGAHTILPSVSGSAKVSHANVGTSLLGKIPANFIDPFQTNDILSVLIIAAALGFAIRILHQNNELPSDIKTALTVFDSLAISLFEAVKVALGWLFKLIPLAVFAVVAQAVGKSGVASLLSLWTFVATVFGGLLLQTIFYVARLRFSSWVRPVRFLKGSAEAALTAFSTASSAATLPITFEAAKDRIGVRPETATLGVIVGQAFNHDGAALYEASAALFIGQAIGLHLGIAQQTVVVLLAMLASVGSAGIPNAGLVTLTGVFTAVGLPLAYIPLLLPLDWLIDRGRTAVNVLGDLALTSCLDGKTAP